MKVFFAGKITTTPAFDDKHAHAGQGTWDAVGETYGEIKARPNVNVHFDHSKDKYFSTYKATVSTNEKTDSLKTWTLRGLTWKIRRFLNERHPLPQH